MKIAKVLQLLWLVLFFMTVAFPGIALADGRTDAVKLVKEAIAYYKTYGIEKTVETLNNPNGPFVRGDLYVFAYSFDGIMLANVSKPNLVGQKVIDAPDTNGKKFRREIIEKAKRDGFGWADYVTSHPKTRLNQQKTSYFEAVDEEIVLSCGIYKEEAAGVKSDSVTRSR